MAMPSSAQQTRSPTPAEAEPQAGKKEKKICRTDRMTGSLTRRQRICLTESEWRRVSSETQQGFNDYVNSASNKSLGGG
jgi:predicted secreted protein